eukprot:1144270-Pelagomonas_calceolata.AAC.2
MPPSIGLSCSRSVPGPRSSSDTSAVHDGMRSPNHFTHPGTLLSLGKVASASILGSCLVHALTIDCSQCPSPTPER